MKRKPRTIIENPTNCWGCGYLGSRFNVNGYGDLFTEYGCQKNKDKLSSNFHGEKQAIERLKTIKPCK